MWEFGQAKPGEYDISSTAVQAFEERLARLGVRMHGYLLLCRNKIVAEKYHEPYGSDTRHRMYSITKSFTSMAVGLLLKQNKIALDDPICSYFPEKLPKDGPHPWCSEMTIRDMLTMRTCYASTTFKRYGGEDWVESFFHVKPDHVPGTVFSYDTSSSHVLAALVEKLTGMDMLDYLRREALDRLGFSADAYIIKDPDGVSQGGSGLMCTLRDVARAAWLCSHYGILDGEELIPAEFMRQAVSNQVPTDMQSVLDEQCGYGYLFWRSREDGFTMYGLGGQLALCFPKLDLCLVTMADTIGNPAGLQMIYDSFYDILFPAVCGAYGGEWERSGGMKQRTEIEQRTRPWTESQMELRGETTAASFQGARTGLEKYVCYENSMGWKWLEFDWDSGKLSFENPEGIQEMAFGLGEWRRQMFPGTSYRCECRGLWKMGHFLLHCFTTDEEQGHVSMDFAWKNERLSVRMVSTGEPFLEYFKGTGSAFRLAEK